MFPTFTVALATFFATIGPVDVAAVFAALTARASEAERRAIAFRGIAIAAGILLTFAFLGDNILRLLGISLAALRTAGGILLLLIGIEMVWARTTGATSTTSDETQEARLRDDISVFPLGTPLIAGPGAIGAMILLMGNAEGEVLKQTMVIGGALFVLLLTLAALLAATQLQKLLGVTGMHVISRIFGVLLCALAVQFMFDGIRQSGLITG